MSNTISAAATGLPGLSRRTFARSAAAVLAVASAPAAAVAAVQATPAGGAMVRLYAAYIEAVDRVNALPIEAPDAMVDPLWQKTVDIADAALVAPVETTADGAAGIKLYSAMTDGCEPEDRDVAFLLRVAERLAEIAAAEGIA